MSEINDINNNLPPTSSINQTNHDDALQKQTEQVPSQPNQSDSTLSLTSNATLLQSVQETLEATPVVDNARVEAIRAAIADGSYHVDSRQLAQSMIDFEQSLH